MFEVTFKANGKQKVIHVVADNIVDCLSCAIMIIKTGVKVLNSKKQAIYLNVSQYITSNGEIRTSKYIVEVIGV